MNDAEFERVLRECTPEVLATLVRRGGASGDLGTAEDALQEAVLSAARQWPTEGIPDNPRGWLVTVASRRLVDEWRAGRARTDREQAIARRAPSDAAASPAADRSLANAQDDTLALMLLCCHPALSRPSQVGLTLKAVGGLSTRQIARAFLVPESTMAQRLSRAKTRLREVGARFVVPSSEHLGDRLAAAAHVLYLVFTEGHTASAGTALSDVSLAQEAIRLTRQLHQRLPSADEVSGLLALMLLTDARRAARVAGDGSLIPLGEQDRSKWDAALVDEGIRLVERVLPSGPVGQYQIQAAIAAVHAEAPSAAATDWRQIVALYAMIDAVAPSAIVTLNRAVAVAHAEGPSAALVMIEPLLADRRFRHHSRLHAVRAHLLEMDGQTRAATVAFTAAARLATNIPEQRYLNSKAASRIGGRFPPDPAESAARTRFRANRSA